MIQDTKPYFLRKGADFGAFWKEYLGSERRDVLFVLGLSFDPRSLECLKAVRACGQASMRYAVLSYDDDFVDSPHMAKMVANNRRELESLIPPDEWNEIKIQMLDGGQSASVKAARALDARLDGNSDIVIDVTGMPAGIYFPMVRCILQGIAAGHVARPDGAKANLHIVVSENPRLDAKIAENSDSDKPVSMHMFDKNLERASLGSLPRVWIPVLGRGRGPQLEMISDEISPKETVPVFPMPSSDPYLSRDLLLEYHKLLAKFNVEPRNFVYSDEQNPFETCRKICRTALYYDEALSMLNGCVVAISPAASKLLCVGCLLAACDLLDDGKRVGVKYMPAQSHRISEAAASDWEPGKLFTMWVAGERHGR